MAKILDLRNLPTAGLRKEKAALKETVIPSGYLRASVVRQFLTCGKKNCRCRRGFKHGPFYYLVQCVRGGGGRVRKFLLKTPAQRARARTAIAAHNALLERLENLSEINTELLRRGEL
jgi:hypothetical protein